MTQKLTEEQQRAAHKIIKANRGDCAYKGNYLNCHNCPKNSESFEPCDNFPGDLLSPEFQAENLRRSQAWLDTHITDAEIMAESPREFCERMVRTDGLEKCFAMIKGNGSLCKTCVLSVNECPCNPNECLSRAKAYLASHPATSQEPHKRRPTPEEMVVGAPVRVRLWDELVRDKVLESKLMPFIPQMRKYCGNTYKIINGSGRLFDLENCSGYFTSEMLDYVEPEKVVSSDYELSRRDRVDWTSRIAKQFESERALVTKSIVKGKVDNLPPGLHFLNFMDLFPVDDKRIVELEKFVKNLTRELNASTRKCEKLQRRLRANWEAKHDGEMATAEEIETWHRSGNGFVIINPPSKILPKGHSSWIPATRGNLKL